MEEYDTLHPAEDGGVPAVDLSAADALDVAKQIVRVLDNRKGHGIRLLHVEERTSLTEYFVLCTGFSRTQVNSLADEVEAKLKDCGVEPIHREGGNGGVWSLIDYGPVIVHVFSRDAREFYNLEKLFDVSVGVDIGDLLTED